MTTWFPVMDDLLEDSPATSSHPDHSDEVSPPVRSRGNGIVAQLAEHWPFKPQVVGSIPTDPSWAKRKERRNEQFSSHAWTVDSYVWRRRVKP